MLKKEFLELVNDIEEDGEIDQAILSNGFSKQIKDLDGLKNLLDTNELVKGIYQKELDSGIGKGVTKYKENFNKNELPKLVEEGIKAKSNEGKSPLEIKVEEQQKEIENMKAEKARAEMSSKYTKDLSTKGLPADLIDFVLGSDEDTTNANIEKISNILSSVTDTKVKEKLNNTNYVPPKNDSKIFGKPTWDDVMKGKASYEDFKKSQES